MNTRRALSPDAGEKAMEIFETLPHSAPRLQDFVRTTWLPHIRARNASWKLDDSIYKNHILPMFGSKRITSISGTDVRQWLTDYEKHECALSTRNRRLHVLKSIFRLAVENGLLSESPTAGIHAKRVKKTRWPSLDREHLTLLMDSLNRSTKREAKVIALLLLTGARKNELLHARWENLFLQEGVLLVSGAGAHAYRKIWLSAEAKEIFQAIPRRKDSPWIFPGRDISKPISDIFLFWKELRAELGLEALSIRDLRYVFADWQLRSGMPMTALRRHLGTSELRDLTARQLVVGSMP